MALIRSRGKPLLKWVRTRILKSAERLPSFFALVALLVFLQQATSPSQATASTGDLLKTSIATQIQKIDGLENVAIQVEGGIVTLSGRVTDSSLRETAAEVVSSQEGVIGVENQLILGGELGVRFEGAFDRIELKFRMLVGYLPLVILAVLILLTFVLMARLIANSSLVRKLAGKNPFLQEVTRQGIKVCVVLIGLVLALDLLDAGKLVGAVFGAAGVAGLALGFAFKDLVENYISSLLLSIRRPFRIGDFVHIGDNEGTVVSLNTRSTILMTLEGNHLRLPNSLVFKSVILNYTTNKERRFDFVVGVGVEEDLVAAQRIGIETLRNVIGTLEEPPPWATITGLGDSNVVIQFFAWVDQSKFSFAKVKGEAIRQVKLALEAAGMDLPEPIHRIKIDRDVQIQDTSEHRAHAKPDTKLAPQETGDVTRDKAIDQQVAEEINQSKERNLLLHETPSE